MFLFLNKRFPRKQMFHNQNIITINLFMMNRLIVIYVHKETDFSFIIEQKKKMGEKYGCIEPKLAKDVR